jgi:hypothetical protein
MKRVLREQEEEGISINNIRDNQAIGIEWSLGGTKSIIIFNRQGTFEGLANNSDYPSTECSWNADTKQEYVTRSLGQHNEVQAFLFKDTKELLKWFSN